MITIFTNSNWPTAQYNKGVYQAQVVQKVDSAIHWINYYLVHNAISFHNTYPHWIAIYPVDSAIQLLNNRGQEYIRSRLTDEKIVEKRMNTNAVRFWDPVSSLTVNTF